MEESALLNQLKTLETSWESLDECLNFWLILVVIGVAMEVVYIGIEYWQEQEAFNRGIIRPPDKPNIWLYGVGLLGAVLVAIGVAGEFSIHLKAGRVEAKIRDTNHRLVSLINERAAAEGLARVKIQASVAWRRLSKEQQSMIAGSLKPCAGLKVGLSYIAGNPEALLFAEDIAAALRTAQCKVSSIQPFSLFGGYGGGVYPLHQLTGVNLSRTDDRLSRDADDAVQHELCSMGFDTTITGKLSASEPEIDVFVVARPATPQGITKLTINTKTHMAACNAGP